MFLVLFWGVLVPVALFVAFLRTPFRRSILGVSAAAFVSAGFTFFLWNVCGIAAVVWALLTVIVAFYSFAVFVFGDGDGSGE